MRTCLAAVSLALAALAWAQDEPKVTLTMPATKASNVTNELKRLTGIQIICNATVGDVPILVSVTDVPLDDLLRQIAAVTGGELIDQGDNGYILTKSDAVRREQSNREFGWVVAAFDAAKKRISQTQRPPDRWDQETLDGLVSKATEARERLDSRVLGVQRQEGQTLSIFDTSMSSQTPASGSARRVLELLPSNVLAGVAPGDRIVYSTLPNRMQRRMPINVQPIVNDFVYNHNLLARAAPQLRPQEGVNIVGSLTSGEPIQGVVETHLVLSRGYRSSTVQVEVKFIDRNGLYVGQGSTSITPQYAQTQLATSEEGKKIELSELSRQMAVIMAQELAAPTSDRAIYRMATVDGGAAAFVTLDSGSDTLPKQFPDELLNVFVNPDKHDPLSLYVSESFIQAAQAEGKDLVAAFPDSVVRDLARVLVKGTVTHKAILAGAPAMGLQVKTEGEWMSVTPTWANNARETAFDRGEAAKLYRAVNGRGFATLDELADYSFFVTTGLPDRTLDMVLLTLINKAVGDQLNEYVSTNLDLLRVYATIPNTAKRQAGEQLQFVFRNLSAAGKAHASHAYYSRPTGFMMPVVGGGEQREFSAMIMTELAFQRGGRPGPPLGSILNEPTEALPNGIPSEAVLNVSRNVQEGVFASTKGVRGGTLLTAQELGMRMGMLDANIGGGGMTLQFDTYRPAQVVTVGVTLDLGEYGRPSAFFKDGWLVNGSRGVSFGQLPEGFRAQVELAKQRMVRPPVVLPDGERPPVDSRRRGGG